MKKIFLSLITACFFIAASANNILVSNISYSSPNITFTIQWDNSWNTSNNVNPLFPTNWDGAWVFVKYQNNIDNVWKHAVLSNANADHSVTGGVLQVDAVSDGMGVFIRRSAPGVGSISTATVTLKMNALVGTGSFNFKVFGTEVVYIPQSDFQLGDGRVSGASYYTVQDINAAKQTSGITAGSLFSGSPVIPAAFPMGYTASYMMKYEMTNEQWADFLNCLTYDQQASRIDIAPNSAVNTYPYGANGSNAGTMTDNVVKIQTTGLNNTLPAVFGCDFDGDNVCNEVNDGQNIACGVLSKADVYAYLDWSGLRPMTEMEYEKACRGTLTRVNSEYAWGTTDLNPHQRPQLSNQALLNESWAGVQANGQIMANAGSIPTSGPARSGVFATGSSGRLSAGAGFYGNMELSGNVWEICVATDVAGVSFNGANGDGVLSLLGEANTATWPAGTLSGVNNGSTIRGGSYYETTSYTFYISTSARPGQVDAGRSSVYGCRGVRTAP